MKLAEDASVFKKKEDLDKENIWSFSVLCHVSRVLERNTGNQIDVFMQDKLSNLLTDFFKKNIENILLDVHALNEDELVR